MIKKKIEIPLYHAELIIIQTKDLQKIEKKYNLQSVFGFTALAFRNHKKNGYTRYVMAFQGKCDTGIIAHESLHTLYYIFEDAKIDFQFGNEEPSCYLLEWIVKECYKFLKVKKL